MIADIIVKILALVEHLTLEGLTNVLGNVVKHNGTNDKATGRTIYAVVVKHARANGVAFDGTDADAMAFVTLDRAGERYALNRRLRMQIYGVAMRPVVKPRIGCNVPSRATVAIEDKIFDRQEAWELENY